MISRRVNDDSRSLKKGTKPGGGTKNGGGNGHRHTRAASGVRICNRSVNKQNWEAEGVRDYEHRDIILPLCFGVFESVEGPGWLQQQFGQKFDNIEGYFGWRRGEQVRRRQCDTSSTSGRVRATIGLD